MYKILLALFIGFEIGISISNHLKLKKIMDKFDPLIAEVSDATTVMSSAAALLDGLATRLEEAKDDPQQIAGIVSDLRTGKTTLSEAITRNTVAETETPVEETPTEETPVEGEGTGSAGGPTSTDNG